MSYTLMDRWECSRAISVMRGSIQPDGATGTQWLTASRAPTRGSRARCSRSAPAWPRQWRQSTRPVVMPNDPPALRPQLSAAKLIELAGWHGKRRWGLNIHDVYAMFAGLFRIRRMQEFVRMFDLKDSDKVLDVGGARGN